jgi:hypothetical protein
MDEVTYPAWTELYGETRPRSLAAANDLAVSYRLTGNMRRALQFDEETPERRRAPLGGAHLWTVISAINVARDLLEAGRYTEAAAPRSRNYIRYRVTLES